jgi:hypothetical protein
MRELVFSGTCGAVVASIKSMTKLAVFCLFLACCLSACAAPQAARQKETRPASSPSTLADKPAKELRAANPGRVIHVVVALCDNASQGIAPVPAAIGNGDDPARNLYWGAGFGVKSYFRKQSEWLPLTIAQPAAPILERVVFKHRAENAYLVADAYQGREIKRAIQDFFAFNAGRQPETIEIKGQKLHLGGAANLVAYIGHDGLMEFSVDAPERADDEKRDAIMLACISKSYFAEPLRKTGAQPLLWTKQLMAPEAYTLKAALDGWLKNESAEQVRQRAAAAYAKYQRISQRAALGLFATGF